VHDKTRESTYLSGKRAERRAEDFLRRRGYAILVRNYHARGGELDLVAREGDCLVFVEVKARRTRAFGTAEEALTARKRARLRYAARHFLSRHRWDGPVRFDVVALQGGRARLYRNALEA